MKQIPSSVYRIQFSKDFTFFHATKLIPYLFKLGIEGVYGSPIFKSFSLSYDIVDPNQIDPALGSAEEFNHFCVQLKKYEMVFILDIIPNHMGIKGEGNKWWIDVLKNGLHSEHAKFFDINWELQGKVVLPILNESYKSVLKKGELKLSSKDGLWINYFDCKLPVRQELPFTTTQINQNPDLMHQLLQMQFYRLAPWTAAGDEINYRRFFNINELIAIRIENEDVFKSYHRLVFSLIKDGKVQGLRVDHPDGLYNPSEYFERIRSKTPILMWIEKILDLKEEVPKKWKIDGTVGYEFLNTLSGLFVHKKNSRSFTKIYNQFVERETKFEEIAYERRKSYIALNMGSEIDYLYSMLRKLAKDSYDERHLNSACIEIIACFPVYRTYIVPGEEIEKRDRAYVLAAIEIAKGKAPELDPIVFQFISTLLLLQHEFQSEDKILADRFVMRFQQITAPAMAKGLEDSTFYLYNRLISLNEVGNNPSIFGVSKEDFHKFNKEKLALFPLGALASSTHDTKYSEDARLRLHTISEMPKLWKQEVKTLKKKNQKFKTLVNGHLIPDFNTEYYIYQLLIALCSSDKKRIWDTLNKAIREAGIHTSWPLPNLQYEEAVKRFLESMLDNMNQGFLQFQEKASKYGAYNSLSALVLKVGSCGIVDIYQGNEILNYCLVDPDNRSSVDFDHRNEILNKQNDLKMVITQKALNFRRDQKELFLKGKYIPIKTPENVVAFIRQWRGQEVLIAVRRFFTEAEPGGSVKLTKSMEGRDLRDIFTNKKVPISKDTIDFADIFEHHPFAILSTN